MTSRFSLSILTTAAGLALSLSTGCAPRRGAAPAGTRDGGAGGYLIRGVNVVDVEEGRLLPDRDVLIRDGVIERVDSGAKAPPATPTIDGRGRYLIPGLFDAHVHYVTPAVYGPLLVAHGVTFVRDMGSPPSVILQLRNDLNSGRIIGPQMAVASMIDAAPPLFPFAIPANTPAEGRAAVRRLAALGADQIKIYSKLAPDVYRAILAEAASSGLKAVGHVPYRLTFNEAVSAGQASIEHLFGVANAILPPGVPRPRSAFAESFGPWEAYASRDTALLRKTFQAAAARGTAQVPTLVLYEGIANSGRPDADLDSNMSLVPLEVRGMWKAVSYGEMPATARRVLPALQDAVRRMHSHGVSIVVGSDLSNHHTFAGASTHREMALLAEAGLPPLDVLRAATINAARLMGVESRFGSVRPGKVASLVLLTANPLERAANAASIDAVFLAGKYFHRAALDSLVETAKRAAGGIDAMSEDFADPEFHIPGDTIFSRRYVVRLGDQVAGRQTLVATRTRAGIELRAVVRAVRTLGDPSAVRYTLDSTWHLQRLVVRTLDPSGRALRYTRFGDTLAVSHASGDSTTTLLAHNSFVLGPEFTSDMVVLRALSLGQGDRAEVTLRQASPPGIPLGEVRASFARLTDTTILSGGQTVKAQAYRSEQVTPWGPVTSLIWLSPDGVLIRAVSTGAFGTLTVESQDR